MTRDQAIDILLSRLGQRGNDAVLKAAAVLELAFAQERLEGDKFKAWFLLSEMQDSVTTAGEERMPLPTGFLQEPDAGAMWRLTGVTAAPRVELLKTDYDLGVARYPTSGKPVKYSLSGKYFRLHPTPDAVYNLQSQFYVRDTALTDVYGSADGAATNEWLTNASDWLIAETGYILATTYTRDKEAAQAFAEARTLARARVYTETVARIEANYSRQMGDD